MRFDCHNYHYGKNGTTTTQCTDKFVLISERKNENERTIAIERMRMGGERKDNISST